MATSDDDCYEENEGGDYEDTTTSEDDCYEENGGGDYKETDNEEEEEKEDEDYEDTDNEVDEGEEEEGVTPSTNDNEGRSMMTTSEDDCYEENEGGDYEETDNEVEEEEEEEEDYEDTAQRGNEVEGEEEEEVTPSTNDNKGQSMMTTSEEDCYEENEGGDYEENDNEVEEEEEGEQEDYEDTDNEVEGVEEEEVTPSTKDNKGRSMMTTSEDDCYLENEGRDYEDTTTSGDDFYEGNEGGDYEDTDDEVEEEEEEEEEDYEDTDNEVEGEEKEEDDEEEQLFSRLCARLQRNDRKIDEVSWGSTVVRISDIERFFTEVPFDDAHCIRFAKALEGNTCLKTLAIMFNRPGCLTFQGSAALANAFGKSKLKSIMMFGESYAIQRSMFYAVRQSQRIQDLALRYTDVDFMALSALLYDSHDDAMTRNTCSVVSLKLNECRLLNENNLKLLAVALHGNNSVKSLSLQGSSIDDIALSGFFNFWSPDSQLAELNLSRNHLHSNGVRLLMGAAAVHPSFIKLDISYNRSIGLDGIRLLGEDLGNVHLKELCITNCENPDDVDYSLDSELMAFDALTEGLRKNATIEKIDSDINNGIDPERLQSLLRATTNRPVLLHLDLITYTTNEIRAIGEELSSARLKELHVRRVGMISDMQDKHTWNAAFRVLLHGLQNNISLRTISLDDWLLGSIEVDMLMMALRSHPSVEKLVLRRNSAIGYLGIQRIGEQLAFTRLKSITLNDILDPLGFNSEAVDVTDEACQALAEGLRNSTTIQELRFNYSCFTAAQALLLVRAVTNHPSMTKLYIGVDTGHDLGQMKHIADEIPSLNLTTLDIGSNLETMPTKNTASKAYQLALAAFQQGIKNNFHLCHLRFTFLGFDEQIEFYLDLNRYGRLRLLEGQGLAPALWCYLLEGLKNGPSLMYYFLREHFFV